MAEIIKKVRMSSHGSSFLPEPVEGKIKMKTYTIEIRSYPQEFIISATSEREAKEKATKRFTDATNGASVYRIEVTNVKPIN